MLESVYFVLQIGEELTSVGGQRVTWNMRSHECLSLPNKLFSKKTIKNE